MCRVISTVSSSSFARSDQAYAMTEAAHQMTSNPLPPAAHKPGSVGVGQV